MKDKILKMQVQCLRGHKSVRRLAEHQIHDVTNDLFKRMYVCLECGSNMSHIHTEIHNSRVEGIFLCPIHGPQKREFPSQFLPAVGLLGADIDISKSIIDSFRCHLCGQVYAVSGIIDHIGALELDVRCSNGHKSTRFLPVELDESLKTHVMQRVAHCDRCGLPGHISYIDERKEIARVTTTCPIHGDDKKDIPVSYVQLLQEAVSEIPDDAIVNAMLTSQACRTPLVIRTIEETKHGYKFKCACPGQGDVTDMVIPVTWSDPTVERVAAAILTCEECGLLTHILEQKKGRKAVDFKVVCPIHGVLTRAAPPDVFKLLREYEGNIDRVPSIARSLSCTKCRMPVIVHDVEERRDLIQFNVECRSGHGSKRFFIPQMKHADLTSLYKQLYQCPECYGPLELVDIEAGDPESRVVLLCSLHGKHILDIPPNHANAMGAAYAEIQADKLTPPVEASAPEPADALDIASEQVVESQEGVHVYRGCEIVGSKFDYKVKVQNDSGYVITNLTVSIVAYPRDCMELAGETVKTISRVEVGGFRSPQFTFYPTRDCVQGKIVATVSFIDFRDQLHTLQVEPYLIRSVCDLLRPSERTSKEFDAILSGLEQTRQEQALDWNARVLFTKAEMLLPSKNFHIVDSTEHTLGGEFIGTIRGFAEGKYTGRKVAVVFLISGPENGRHSMVKVEALGEDVAMLPTTIDELADSMDSWICLRCGAPLETEQVEELETRKPIRCKYCSHSLTIALYLR